MARPRTKGDPIHIRLTENDHARYTAHAEKADVSLAFYITNILAGALQFLDGTLTGVRADVVRDQLTAPVGVARMRERAERLEAGQAKTVRVGDALGVTGVLYEEPTVEERRVALDEMAAATAPLGIDYGLEAKPGGLGASVSAAIHDQLDRVLAGEGLRLAPRDDLEEKVAGAGPYEDGSAWAPSDHEARMLPSTDSPCGAQAAICGSSINCTSVAPGGTCGPCPST